LTTLIFQARGPVLHRLLALDRSLNIFVRFKKNEPLQTMSLRKPFDSAFAVFKRYGARYRS